MKLTIGAILGIVALTTILVVSQPVFAQYATNPPSTTPSTMPSTTPAQAGNAIPEFGPVTSLILAIAIMSMIVFAAKTRVIPRLQT